MTNPHLHGRRFCKLPKHIDLVLLADTHELHREIDVPFGDILIHAGDFSMLGRDSDALRDFDRWLGELPHRHKLVIPGNHDRSLESHSQSSFSIANAKVLINRGVQISGLRFWGSPVTAGTGGAFNISCPADREKQRAKVPDDVDVLITHGPPFGILDRQPGQTEPTGDPELLRAVQRVQPMLHVFGHTHGANGQSWVGQTLHLNCALLGLEGGLTCSPTIIRIPRR